MSINPIVEKAVNLAKAYHSSDTTGHDWWHVYRVWRLARYIALHEGADMPTVELAALFHDMDDYKIIGVHNNSLANAREALQELNVDNQTAQRVIRVIEEVSFRGAGVHTTPSSPEACVVQDADRLDAIGAIGIARAFAYGGANSREMHIPQEKPNLHKSFDEYKNATGSTINHFYEKLILLKDRLNTNTAKALATGRHEFLLEFLNRFLEEWELKDIDNPVLGKK